MNPVQHTSIPEPSAPFLEEEGEPGEPVLEEEGEPGEPVLEEEGEPGAPKYNVNSFYTASSHGDLDLLKSCIKYCKKYVNLTSVFRNACENGHLNVVKYLKENFPDINHRIHHDEPFRLACRNGHLEVVKWLKENFPEIDHRAKDDLPFCLACSNGHLEVVTWLKKISPNMKQCIYQTSFRSACKNRHLKVAKWLKKNFPDIDVSNIYAKDPVDKWLKTIKNKKSFFSWFK